MYWSQKAEESVSGPAAITKEQNQETLDNKNMKSQVIQAEAQVKACGILPMF